MNSKLHTELGYYLKEHFGRKVPFAEFCDLRNASFPENLESVKSRIIINYGAMFGNYAYFFAAMGVLYLLLHPYLIIPCCFGVWLLYLISQSEEERVAVAGKRLKREYLYSFAFCVIFLPFLISPKSLVSLFFTVGVSLLISLVHMVMRSPPSRGDEV